MVDISRPALWSIFSNVIGATYTLAWSLSFYPQLILNYRRRSVTGFSMDYAHLNVLGHGSYALYTLAFLCSKNVQSGYRQRHPHGEPLVRWNDALFASHAFLLSGLTLLQTYSSSYQRDKLQSISRWTRIVLSVALLSTAVGAVLAISDNLAWIDVVYFMSFIKLSVSFVKCLPQLYLNWKRKSTQGWSIVNVALDFLGGFLSLLQLIVDCALVNDFSAITGNVAKSGLAALSLSFDILFLTQHYILYRHLEPSHVEETAAAASENDRLLAASNLTA